MQKDLLKQLKDISALIITFESLVTTSLDMDEAISADALIKVNEDIGKLIIEINEEMLEVEDDLVLWKRNNSMYPVQVSKEISYSINDIKLRFTNLLKGISQRGTDIDLKRKILISALEKIKTNKRVFQGYRTTAYRDSRIIKTDA